MAKLTDPCVVYWKHTPEMTDKKTQGYIGISGNFEYRMKQHDRDAYLLNSPLEVHHQMRLNEGNIITEVIHESDREDCLAMEHELRPRWHIAWNMAAGGKFGSYWKASGDWLSQKIYNPEFGEVYINRNFTMMDFMRAYPAGKPNNTGGISQLLRGRTYEYRGWQLQDAQLAQRVWDRCKRPIEEVGLKYASNDTEFCKIYPNAWGEFSKYINISGMPVYTMLRGLRPSARGYSLCTEKEYLANPGPVFGTEE